MAPVLLRWLLVCVCIYMHPGKYRATNGTHVINEARRCGEGARVFPPDVCGSVSLINGAGSGGKRLGQGKQLEEKRAPLSLSRYLQHIARKILRARNFVAEDGKRTNVARGRYSWTTWRAFLQRARYRFQLRARFYWRTFAALCRTDDVGDPRRSRTTRRAQNKEKRRQWLTQWRKRTKEKREQSPEIRGKKKSRAVWADRVGESLPHMHTLKLLKTIRRRLLRQMRQVFKYQAKTSTASDSSCYWLEKFRAWCRSISRDTPERFRVSREIRKLCKSWQPSRSLIQRHCRGWRDCRASKAQKGSKCNDLDEARHCCRTTAKKIHNKKGGKSVTKSAVGDVESLQALDEMQKQGRTLRGHLDEGIFGMQKLDSEERARSSVVSCVQKMATRFSSARVCSHVHHGRRVWTCRATTVREVGDGDSLRMSGAVASSAASRSSFCATIFAVEKVTDEKRAGDKCESVETVHGPRCPHCPDWRTWDPIQSRGNCAFLAFARVLALARVVRNIANKSGTVQPVGQENATYSGEMRRLARGNAFDRPRIGGAPCPSLETVADTVRHACVQRLASVERSARVFYSEPLHRAAQITQGIGQEMPDLSTWGSLRDLAVLSDVYEIALRIESQRLETEEPPRIRYILPLSWLENSHEKRTGVRLCGVLRAFYEEAPHMIAAPYCEEIHLQSIRGSGEDCRVNIETVGRVWCRCERDGTRDTHRNQENQAACAASCESYHAKSSRDSSAHCFGCSTLRTMPRIKKRRKIRKRHTGSERMHQKRKHKDRATCSAVRPSREAAALVTLPNGCPYCRAAPFFKGERSACCMSGKLVSSGVFPLHDERSKNGAAFLRELLKVPQIGRKSLRMNTLLTWARFGSKVQGVRKKLQRRHGRHYDKKGGGLCVGGIIYHRMLHLHDKNKHNPLRWWLYRGSQREAEESRLRSKVIKKDSERVRCLMDRVNPFAGILRRWRERSKQVRRVRFQFDAARSEVGMLVDRQDVDASASAKEVPTSRQVIARAYGNRQPSFVPTLSPLYEPLAYSLLTPTGRPGWGLERCKPAWAKKVKQWSASLKDTLQGISLRAYAVSIMRTSRALWNLFTLAEQWLCDQFLRTEEERFANILKRKRIAAQYQKTSNAKKSTTYLPGTHTQSPRWYQERTEDAFTVVQRKGAPTLMITLTCNGKWPEIVNNLPRGATAEQHPLITTRVFRLKLFKLLHYIKRHPQTFGRAMYVIRVIEFQKRNLPHAHILLRTDWREVYRSRVDFADGVIVCDRKKMSRTEFQAMRKHMSHKCSEYCRPKNSQGKAWPWFRCRFGFPSPAIAKTRESDDGFIEHRRGCKDERLAEGNPKLVRYMDAHVHIRVINTHFLVLSYCLSYFTKGEDLTSFYLDKTAEKRKNKGQGCDEIKHWRRWRYTNAMQAAWRLQAFNIVQGLKVHTVRTYALRYRPGQVVGHLEDVEKWFARPYASRFRRMSIVQYFSMYAVQNHPPKKSKKLGRVFRDQRGRYVFRHPNGPQIWRLQTVYPSAGPRFFLSRILQAGKVWPRCRAEFRDGKRRQLHYKTAWRELRTWNGKTHATFEGAAVAAGLIGDADACAYMAQLVKQGRSPSTLRWAWLMLAVHTSAPVLRLFKKFKTEMSADYLLEKCPAPVTKLVAYLRDALQQHDKNPDTLKLPNVIPGEDPTAVRDVHKNRSPREFVRDYLGEYPQDVAQRDWDKYRSYLHPEQMAAVRTVRRLWRQWSRMNTRTQIKHIKSTHAKATPWGVRLVASAGCGKTVTLRAILSDCRRKQGTPLVCASTGCAAMQLRMGRTAHKRFGIPVRKRMQKSHGVTATPIIAPNAGTGLGELFRRASLIIWDEIGNSHAEDMRGVRKLFTDLKSRHRSGVVASSTRVTTKRAYPGAQHSAKRYPQVRKLPSYKKITRKSGRKQRPGGVPFFIFAGDAKQIPPVIPWPGTRKDIHMASVRSDAPFQQLPAIELRTALRCQSQRVFRYLNRLGAGMCGGNQLTETGARVVRLPSWFPSQSIGVSASITKMSKLATRHAFPNLTYFRRVELMPRVLEEFNWERYRQHMAAGTDPARVEKEDKRTTHIPATYARKFLRLSRGVVLSPLNKDCRQINSAILKKWAGSFWVFPSTTKLRRLEHEEKEREASSAVTFGLEGLDFLQHLEASGALPGTLRLKVGALTSLQINLDPAAGLLKNTRLMVVQCHSEAIAICKISDINQKTGEIAKVHYLPRVWHEFEQRIGRQVLPLYRYQFPVALAYACTIDRSQGQSFDRVAVNLMEPVFAHGHLYVALSRCTSLEGMLLLVTSQQLRTDRKNRRHVITQNIVFPELLEPRDRSTAAKYWKNRRDKCKQRTTKERRPASLRITQLHSARAV